LLGVLLFFASSASVFRAVDGESLSQECSSDVQKVMGCLSYATGKANTPPKDCCSAVQGIKDSDPKCLCYTIQQAHNASSQFKSFGVQEAKLLQLPTACQLQNASLSFCPSEYLLPLSLTHLFMLFVVVVVFGFRANLALFNFH